MGGDPVKKQILKKILSALFFVVVFGLTLWSVFGNENMAQLKECLRDANDLYIIPGVLCVIGFILGEALIIFYMVRSLNTPARFTHCCLYSFIGFFYSAITPSASGGQPMQMMYMRRTGIPVAVSTVVLAIVTVLYKLVLVLIGLGVLLIRPARIMTCLEPVEGFMYLGLVLNVIFIIAIIAVLFMPNLVRRMGKWVFRLVGKLRPFRDPGKQEARLERVLGQYQGATEYFKTHPVVICNVFVITTVQRLLLFLVAWLTYKAFGLSGESAVVIVLLYAMISVAADMLPLPGGMGISENLFLTIFLPIFGETLILPGMVACRGISYYTQLVISAIMTLVAVIIFRKREANS